MRKLCIFFLLILLVSTGCNSVWRQLARAMPGNFFGKPEDFCDEYWSTGLLVNGAEKLPKKIGIIRFTSKLTGDLDRADVTRLFVEGLIKLRFNLQENKSVDELMSQSLDALSVQPPWVNCDDGIGKFDQFYPRSFLSDENRNKLRTEVGVEAVFVGYFAAWRYYPSPSFLGDRNKKMASSYLAVLLLDVDSRDLIWGCNISNGGMVRSYPRYIEVPIGRALRFFEKDLKKAGITLR